MHKFWIAAMLAVFVKNAGRLASRNFGRMADVDTKTDHDLIRMSL